MTSRKTFHDSVSALPPQSGTTASGMKVQATTAEHAQDTLTLNFHLEIPKDRSAELENLVAKGEVISPDQLHSRFGLTEADTAPLRAWLSKEGFEVLPEAGNHTSVSARGTVAQIEKSLGVQMVRVTDGGITCTAARNAPSLPSEVAALVDGIGGLQPFRRAHRHFRRVMATNRREPTEHDLATGVVHPAVVDFAPPYTVDEVLKAYDADNLGLTGHGQVIAILIDTFPSDADMKGFWQRNGLPAGAARITKINVAHGPLPPAEGEETLDAQWTSGIAPGAQVRIYASGSLQFSALNRALDRIIADLPSFPTLRQMSISLGLGESYMQPAELRAQHARYLRLAAAGVNVFVSSGDAGSNPDTTGHGSTGPLQAEYGASDPAVIAVGGTTLSMSPGGGLRSETGWADGGGGQSQTFPRPSWQKAVGMATGHGRLVPDVSLAADPNTGAYVFFNHEVQQIGGTSWSAPVWAGFCALLNEARAKAGQKALPFLNTLLYPLAGSDSFRDITSGSNGAYEASAGHDMVTGLGVPNVRALVKALT